MPSAVAESANDATITLSQLLNDIERLQAIQSSWTPEQQNTVTALGKAQDALQAEAWRRVLRGLTDIPEAAERLRALAGDEVVYAVLRHHGLVKASLDERVEEALKSVRPMLHGHGGDVEVVAITPPDRIAVRLTGNCDGCPASAITLAAGVEQAIRKACPEIQHIDTRPGRAQVSATETVVSPFSADGEWLAATTLTEIPEAGVLPVRVADQSLILSRQDERVQCFEDACAHMGMPLTEGSVADGILTCPHHGFAYSLQDGSCITAPGVTLIAHPARVVNGQVEVKLK